MKGKFEIFKQVCVGINLIVFYKYKYCLLFVLDFKELIKYKRKDWNSNDISIVVLCKWLLIIFVVYIVISIMKI